MFDYFRVVADSFLSNYTEFWDLAEDTGVDHNQSGGASVCTISQNVGGLFFNKQTIPNQSSILHRTSHAAARRASRAEQNARDIHSSPGLVVC
jgi:hypothetical protein